MQFVKDCEIFNEHGRWIRDIYGNLIIESKLDRIWKEAQAELLNVGIFTSYPLLKLSRFFICLDMVGVNKAKGPNHQ